MILRFLAEFDIPSLFFFNFFGGLKHIQVDLEHLAF